MLVKKSSLILSRLAQIWSLVLFGLLLISSLLVQTSLPMDGSEMAKMVATSPLIWIGAAFILFVIYCLLRDLPKIKPIWLFLAGSLIYLILASVLIGQVPDVLRDDARAVYDSALAINKGDYGSLLEGGYLYRYPHQLGLVTYERILFALAHTSSAKFLFGLNLLMVLASNFLTWKLTELFFKKAAVTNLVIILSFFFLPQFFFILFAYGLVPGLFFSLLAFYSFIAFMRNGRAVDGLVFLIAMILAYIIRNNYIILTLSFAIIALLDAMYQKRFKTLILVLLTFMLSFGANRALTWHYESLSKTDLSGEPKIAWVTMGLNDRPIYNRVAGWYDAYVETVYSENDGDFSKIAEQSQEDLADRISYMTSHPAYAFTFFKNKFLSTWTDGLFQSIWSGPIKKLGQTVNASFAKSIYEGKTGYRISYSLAHMILILLYLGVFSGLIFLIKSPMALRLENLIAPVYLTGGFLFHLVWETKSQYVYPYIFLILPLAAFGLVKLLEKAASLRQKQSHKVEEAE
ncbi:hypothetical protein [Streptococcus loxodontisalivarius]|uniref:Glycosyltransferase RgtA/B/C/D-like domain-containing protein n=1 Tax=Streptococcus loxodontisalivarius TaxID=1349415 RepID=A0ABS2PRY9_9STRE|nr:hypothetical protein [Streptococcus loxodontisalivarius]MBM7642792.1 hypothetical protein [Streptococcus loxodontisalivarius]